MSTLRQVWTDGSLLVERILSAIRKKQIKMPYTEKIRLYESRYNNTILYNQDGNDLVATSLQENQPIMVARLGATELACLSFYLHNRRRFKKKYPKGLTDVLSNNAGVFPVHDDLLDKFSELYLDCIENTDIMAVWFNHDENTICNTYCPQAKLVELGCLESFLFKKPWSSTLRMKKVLVVHPFVESIKKQYAKRDLLFDDPEVLPEFELKTIQAVQSIAGSKVNYVTWFDALDDMCQKIEQTEFDIAIIGAGAYGLPLASFVKRLGKQAIHLGGVTQILFGITGKRWELGYADSTAKLFNEHWVRPLEKETPPNKDSVENGCYW